MEDYENNTEDTVKQTASCNILSSYSDAELMEKSEKKTILFEDSSDGEEEKEAVEENFKIKSQFEGNRGQKVRT